MAAGHGAIGKIAHWRVTKRAVEDARVQLERVVKDLSFMLHVNINSGVDKLKARAEKAAGAGWLDVWQDGQGAG